MRLYEIAQPTTPEVLEVLAQNCAPYLAEIGNVAQALYGHPLYRGIDHQIPRASVYERIAVRQDRKPRNSPAAIHQRADDWLATTLPSGIRYRSSSLFCTGDLNMAANYGIAAAVVIPIGSYNYCYSPTFDDLYLYLKIAKEQPNTSLEDMMKKGRYVENKNLVAAIDSGNEIMLHCNEAIVIRQSWCEGLSKAFDDSTYVER